MLDAIPPELSNDAESERWAGVSNVYLEENAARTLAYGAGEHEALSWFAGLQPCAPSVLVIHGGAPWSARSLAAVAAGPRAHGFAVGLLDHDGPQGGLTALLAQVRRGVRHLAGRLASLGGDPSRLLLAGHGLGAALAAELVRLPEVNGAIGLGGWYEPLLACRPRRAPALVGQFVLLLAGPPRSDEAREAAAFLCRRLQMGHPDCIVSLPAAGRVEALDALADPDGLATELLLDLAGMGPGLH